MAPKLRTRLARVLAHTTLADLGRVISNAVYAVGKRSIYPRVIQDVQNELKAYDEIGSTEVSATMNSQWVGQPQQNLEILARLYETHPWVKICTSWIAEALAGIPLRTYKAVGFEDGKEVLEPADESDVGRMIRWVNPQQSQSQFIEDLACWLILNGEAFVYHADPGPQTPIGIPAEWYVLFSPFVEKVVSPVHGIIAYQYNVTGEVTYLDPERVTYFKTFSPTGRFRGQGTPAAGFKTIQTDQELREFNQKVLRQGVHLSGILETDNEDLDADQADMIRAKFEKQYAGSSNAHRIAVLWGGLQFSPQTILQKDVLMTEQLAASRDEIIALFGLKPELITEKFANKATAETVRRMAYEDTILGKWGKRIESVWNSIGLMKYDPDLRIYFDTAEVPALQTSNREKVETAEIALRAGMTVNETRDTILGLPPSDDPEMDLINVPNQTPAPEPSEKPVKFGTIDVKAGGDEIVFARLQRTADARLERALRSVYREIGKETRTIVTRSEVHSKILADLEQAFFFNGRKAVVKSMSDAVRVAINDAVEIELARLAKVGVEGVFDVKPVRALARLNQQEKRIRDMMGREWLDLRKEVSNGLAMGESESKLSQRVGGFFEGMRNNAATIARTETIPAINGATVDVALAAREKGVDVVSVWHTANDERVRTPPRDSKNHQAAHGLTIIPGEELFVVSGQKMEYPGDSWNGATPDNTINCRCGVRNEVRDKGDEIIPADNRGEL